MCAPLLVSILAASVMAQSPASQPAPRHCDPVGADDGLFPYRLTASGPAFADTVTERDGAKHLGKVMEWADQVLVFKGTDKPLALSVPEVDQFQFRRGERHKVAPNLPDLTVAYVERLPRDPSLQGHVIEENGVPRTDVDTSGVSWHPAAGSEVTFKIHVLNGGFADSGPVPCKVSIDGAEVGSATVPALKPRAEHEVSVTWRWQEGAHTLRVDIDPDGGAAEIVRWNNIFVEPVQGLAVAVVVARDRYEAYQRNRNLVDSFCFEDWVQYQLRSLNGLFRASMYPSSPQGAMERVRCDRISVVDDPANAERRPAWEATLRQGGRPDGLAEYAATLVWGKVSEDEAMDLAALRIDWPQARELARQLGLIEWTKTDTRIEQCMVLDSRGRYVQRCHLFPDRATFMYATGGFALDEDSVGALNQVLGRPRGFRGDFLYQLPAQVVVEVLSNAGLPLPGVQIDGFQLLAEGEYAGCIAGAGRGDPLFSAQTDQQGRLVLPDLPAPAARTPGGYELRPNPFGKIATDGSNGLLLLRLRQGKAEEYYFLRLYDCNIACLRGQRDMYLRQLRTRFAGPAASASPLFTAIRMPVRTADMPPLQVCWRLPDDVPLEAVEEFRVYKRTSFGDDAVKPWTLASVLPQSPRLQQLCSDGTYFDEFRYDGPYSLDTFYAVSIVDRQGHESSLSPPGCLAYDKDSISFAMDKEVGYISLAGDGPAQMMCWDGATGTQNYGVRTLAFKGYRPRFGGVAVSRDGRLIVADPINHVLAFYERGDLVEVVPNRPWWPGFPSDEPGEFYGPADVAVAETGHIFVADRDNDRVQVLDSRGQFQSFLDEQFHFDGPHAIGYANGHVCVTDKAGTRCRVYEWQPTGARFVRELPPLTEADRALVAKSGKVYLAGRVSAGGTTGILVFVPKDSSAALDHVDTEDTMGGYFRPRGLCQYPGATGGDDWAYFVNEFPFDVRRCKLQ
ncbi:MAG TPA: CARDB domain-containing protein [Phycisphaerae bacterium]|nr:CARDB domain-containing protein [Phycisphaerae bacterium]